MAVSLFAIGLWCAGDMLAQSRFSSEQMLWFGSTVSSFGWSMLPSLVVILFAAFTGREHLLRSKLFLLSLFIIPVLIIYKNFRGEFFIHTRFPEGWSFAWPSTYAAYAFYFSVLACNVLCFRYLFAFLDTLGEDDLPMVRRAKWLIVLTYASFASIFILGILVPMISLTHVPDLTSLVALAWGVMVPRYVDEG